MEGPYRELGYGFARLAGAEGTRRAPYRISSVEDALFELLRNARDAGARNVYVSSILRHRRYRILTVIDDGEGIPDAYRSLVFEPGVTTRHLNPAAVYPGEPPHGAGLSLYHLKNLAESVEVLSPSNPTSIKTVLDTTTVPENTLQSLSRPSRSNIPATLEAFSSFPKAPATYYGSPAKVLAFLLKNHIIQTRSKKEVVDIARRVVGIEISGRTAQRVMKGEVEVAHRVLGDRSIERDVASQGKEDTGNVCGGPLMTLSEEEVGDINRVIQSAARRRYIKAMPLVSTGSEPGKLRIEVSLYEPEEEYE